MRIVSPLGIALTAAVIVTSSPAELIDRFTVGEGGQSASLQFDFLDGRTWIFDVQWDGSLTGRTAFDLIAGDTTGRYDFDFDVISYSFGDFLVGVTVNDAYHHGTGTPPDYLDTWHYWTAETSTDSWTESFIGFNDRMLVDGARDGWVFGTTDAPAVVPAPGAIALLVLGGGIFRRRR